MLRQLNEVTFLDCNTLKQFSVLAFKSRRARIFFPFNTDNVGNSVRSIALTIVHLFNILTRNSICLGVFHFKCVRLGLDVCKTTHKGGLGQPNLHRLFLL